MTELLPDIWAVEVPEDARGFCKAEDGKILYLHGQGMSNMCSKIDALFDDYSILFQTKDAGEEEWKGVVESYGEYGLFYRDYAFNSPIYGINSQQSFQSLLTSKGLDPNKNYLLIRKHP